MSLTYRQAWDLIGGLSKPSKMPWLSWSTPAQRCITGGKLHKVEGTTCSKCYALKGFYMFPNAKKALERRFQALSNPLFVEAFVLVLTTLYNKNKKTYRLNRKTVKENRFRWHDSGDLASLEHLLAINDIAKQTPFLDHWLPTREMTIVKAFNEWQETKAPNLNIRYSVPLIGAKLNSNPHGMTQSTVGRDKDKEIKQCPAPKQGNKCLDCRQCWDPTITVNYHLH